MAERATGYVTHRTRNRLRVRVPERRHDRDWWQRLREALRRQPGVSCVDANPLTAGLLIVHDGSFDPARADLDDLWLVHGHPPLPHREPFLDRSNRWLDQVDGQLRGVTENRFDLSSAALLGLGLTILVQLLRGRVGSPPSVTLAWYAAELMRTRGRQPRDSHPGGHPGFPAPPSAPH